MSKVAALGRASASLSLPLLAERLQGCLAALQQCLQSGELAGSCHSATPAEEEPCVHLLSAAHAMTVLA